MPIPNYEAFMLPLLETIRDGQEWSFRDARRAVAERMNIGAEEQELRIPSGMQVLQSRVGWAKTYLKNAGLLEQPRRAVLRITPEGLAVLARGLPAIDSRFLEQYPQFLEFKGKSRGLDGEPVPESAHVALSNETPEELIGQSHQAMQDALAEELLDLVKSCSPPFFETLVVELLVAMGYGGSLEDAGKAIGRSGDGGIDGIIKEDRLGLDVVCIQAKRWTSNCVGRPDVQAFVGSMDPHRAKKGVFITTSRFSAEAIDYVEKTERKIALIDGKTLATLMIEHDIGVNPYKTYVLKRIDSDYFEQ